MFFNKHLSKSLMQRTKLRNKFFKEEATQATIGDKTLWKF